MNFSRREGPFGAEITGDLLSVHRLQTDERVGGDSLTGRGLTMLFVCSLRKQPWFVMHGDGLYAQNAHDALSPLYWGDDAPQLLACLTAVLQARETGKTGRRRLATGTAIVALLLTAWITLAPPAALQSGLMPSATGVPPAVNPLQGTMNGSDKPGVRVMTPPRPTPGQESLPAATPADGWSLPPAARAGLPDRLRKAASRGLFTVPLSAGHARTLYVFADPACPNCRRMERHYETAAGMVNVVIFPVTIAGRDASLKTLTPVMALPEAERATAWKRLFAADSGIGVPGTGGETPAVTDETLAETARGAIGVNEVAYRAYRLPGTPWTISDDGRYVPQNVLSSPAALMDFLNGGGHDGQ